MTRSTKVHAHDELNSAKIGDLVTVQECRPLSKSKTWMLLSDISNKAEGSTETSVLTDSADLAEGDQS
jgi:ribosomal protein S17